MTITVSPKYITAPVTVTPNVITAPITLGVKGEKGDTGPQGPSGGGVNEVSITDTNLDGNSDYTLNHGLNIAGVPPINVIDSNGDSIMVPVTRVDANNCKIKFGSAITGTFVISYPG